MFETLAHLPLGWLMFAFLAATGFFGFYSGRTRMMASTQGGGFLERPHSQPSFHGYFVALCMTIPVLTVFLAYILYADGFVRNTLLTELPTYITSGNPAEIEQYLDRLQEHAALRVHPDTGNALFNAASERYDALTGQIRLGTIMAALLLSGLGYAIAQGRIKPDFRARTYVERIMNAGLFLCAAVAVVTTIGIILSLVFETVRFFSAEDGPTILDFLFGTEWNAQTGETFGAVPLFFGTFVIALIAMAVAAPVGLFSAIYLSEYASPNARDWIKPILEILAGIPTVVYGFFAMTVVVPWVQAGADWVNALPFIPDETLEGREKNALAAGLVMGIMIIPLVSSLADDVINAVPQSLRDGALALGATKAETIKQVVMPAALPGIIASLLLAVSRAIGETMIVVMAAGQTAQITGDVTSYLSTITVQIVALLTGDTEFDSAKTLSAFALGFVLFLVTLVFNIIALRVVRRYREQYD